MLIFGIFIMRKKFPQTKEVYKVPNWIPVTFIILASVVVLILTIFKPAFTIPGLFISLLGIPVYHYWESKSGT